MAKKPNESTDEFYERIEQNYREALWESDSDNASLESEDVYRLSDDISNPMPPAGDDSNQ